MASSDGYVGKLLVEIRFADALTLGLGCRECAKVHLTGTLTGLSVEHHARFLHATGYAVALHIGNRELIALHLFCGGRKTEDAYVGTVGGREINGVVDGMPMEALDGRRKASQNGTHTLCVDVVDIEAIIKALRRLSFSHFATDTLEGSRCGLDEQLLGIGRELCLTDKCCVGKECINSAGVSIHPHKGGTTERSATGVHAAE